MSTRPKEREATSDVQLGEDLSHVGELPRGRDFMEVNGSLVMGESQGNDLCLAVAAWHVGGGRKGKWRVDDAMMGQTTFVMVPREQRGRIKDNDFISNRQDPTEWLGDIQITQERGRIIWQAGNLQFISRPPYWEIKGEHMGMECHLTLGGLGKATRSYGLWSDLTKTSRAGYEQRCWAEGTITVKGKAYTLEKGFGVHDMMTFGETYDHMEVMREPYHYIWCMSESIQIFLWSMPSGGTSYGCVYAYGQEIPFGQSEVSVDELELWTDPKTAMRVPVRWHVNMNSACGVVDMTIAAGGRGIFCVLNRKGYTMRYSFNTRANGRIFLPDGHNVPLRDMVTYVEWGRAAMPLESGAP